MCHLELTAFNVLYFLELFLDLAFSTVLTLRKSFIRMKCLILLIFLNAVLRNTNQVLQEIKSRTYSDLSSLVMLC